MNEDKNDSYVFEESTVEIKTDKGLVEYPCYVTTYAPGLCVLSAKTVFSVTHIPSGLNVGGEYERFGNAAINLAELQEVAVKHGFSWDSSEDDLHAIRKANKDLKIDIAMCRVVNDSRDEFPYEDEHPLYVASKMLGAKTYNAVIGVES